MDMSPHPSLPASKTQLVISTGVHSRGCRGTVSESNPIHHCRLYVANGTGSIILCYDVRASCSSLESAPLCLAATDGYFQRQLIYCSLSSQS